MQDKECNVQDVRKTRVTAFFVLRQELFQQDVRIAFAQYYVRMEMVSIKWF